MFKLRNALRRATSQVDSFIFCKTGREHSRASISTGPQQQDGTFYEFRTYCIQPHLNAAFHKLTSEKIHLRTAHSELVGYWSVEYGGLNQAFHIWKYGVYELVSFQMKPGGPAVWGESFQGAVCTHAAPGYAHPVGVFHSEFGLLNRLHVLWWYESADHRAAVRHKAHSDARVVSAVRQSVSYLESQRNKLLFPCSYSPLK
ncbi:hypothetical protein QTP70_030757 [Hemibagrus guttatus]|uniref:NIPSNAP domain-containing protein n=1 Tax=Hemibagrus guttatus TaxID=175788 RepID=A0AAE0QPX1_9TELE|nr:hypothetical protein QTP70_030757 [Hemibagrus guttatus]KAK3558520.1 hypothetical protein QTP86_018175 [Hemibagrus guttatus]